MKKALYYGMTRWGGWYVNFIHDLTTYGMTADTHRELLEKCKKENITLFEAKREDYNREHKEEVTRWQKNLT